MLPHFEPKNCVKGFLANLPQNSLGELPAMAHTGESGQGIEYEYCHGAGIHYNWHRYYDPSTGRYLSPDPIVERTNGAVVQYASMQPDLLLAYAYGMNNPLKYIDPDGASPADVEKIRKKFRERVDQLTRERRRTDPGWVNNILSSIQQLWGTDVNKRYLGCGEQEVDVRQNLEGIKKTFDDNWTFRWQGDILTDYSTFPHQYSYGFSDNPNDPILRIDPHRDRIDALPPGSVSKY